ncbi:MAG: alpha/beta hydrolase, partial [Desulfobacterales bacterium]|nr:alpha/beta hydrolase [Desulfobacterales bacterium]
MSLTDFLFVDDHKIEIAWHGPGPEEAPTLVFLHEGLGCVALWRDFPAKLAAATGCGAFVYSRLGYGKSDPCELPRLIRFMHTEGLEVLPRVLEAAGIKECILVGHSDGGSIAIVYAGGTPAVPLRGLITAAAHVFCEQLSVDSIENAKIQYEEHNLRQKLNKYHGANTKYAFRGWNDIWLDPDFMDWNIEEYLPGIQVPILAIQGEEDQYGTRAQIEAIKRMAGPRAKTLLLP